MVKLFPHPFPPSLPALARFSVMFLVIAVLAIIPSLRFVFLYNFLTLCAIGFVIILFYRFTTQQPAVLLLSIITIIALCFHMYNYLRFGVNFAFDGEEYWGLARSIASGQGLQGAMYRPPLYPALVALFQIMGDHSGLLTVVFQHVLLVACVPGIYAVGRMFHFSKEASSIAAAFLAFNSLLMQAAGFIMTEIVFLSLSLISVAMLKRLYDNPSIINSVVSGAMFAFTAYSRQLLFPVLLGGLILLAIRKFTKGALPCLIALAVYFAAAAPWCLRNFKHSGRYVMSAGFGASAFTKASTFDCLDRQGKYYGQIKKPLENALRDLNLTDFTAPLVPEDDWQVNRIPHVLIDSLQMRHGFSFAQASNLLGKAAIEGFAKNPRRYGESIAKSFSTLLFDHHDMYPKANDLFPIVTPGSTTLFRRISRGAVYISGYVFLVFPLALILRKNKRGSILLPFCIVCLMYLATAALQVGFTRYTIPWEPFKALCAAYVMETVLLSCKPLNIRAAELARNKNSLRSFFSFSD